jgi:chemotaxis response regulator CheB
LLTGMGEDGLTGLAAIRQHGGTTFVQTPETCTAPGMPQRAIAAGVADHVASPEDIAHLLLQGY